MNVEFTDNKTSLTLELFDDLIDSLPNNEGPIAILVTRGYLAEDIKALLGINHFDEHCDSAQQYGAYGDISTFWGTVPIFVTNIETQKPMITVIGSNGTTKSIIGLIPKEIS